MASTPFDLNQALLDWRSRLAAAGPCRAEDLEEMESHLRDSVGALEARGLTSDEAFLVAARRLGHPRNLAEEWGKVHPAEVFRTRAIWMLVGFLLVGLLGDVARVVSGAIILGGNLLEAEPLWLGWAGLAGTALTLIVGAALFARFASGRLLALPRAAQDRFRRAAFLGPVLLGTLLGARLAAWAEPVALARELSPSALGGIYVVQGWGQAVGGILLPIVTVLFLVALVRRGSRIPHATTVLVFVGASLVTLGTAPRLEAAPAPPARHAAVGQAAHYDDALQAWRNGKKDEALQKFLIVDFTQRPLFPKGSVLGYSEKDYVALPRAVNDKIQPQLIEEVKPMKAFARHVREAAVAAAQRGDKAQADLYLGQLRKCGEALAHPDSLALLQAVGKAFTRLAAETQAGIPSPKAR